jgi:S-DNA-T family DNA segregation ATPase FtsK/SpoIIIE
LVKKIFRRRAPLPVITSLSLDRKLDIIGVILTLLGLLTVLSLLSSTNSSLTGGWVSGLRAFFGLGMYLFSLGLILTGLWLVLRNFERIPQLSLERFVGIALLFVNLLAIFHFLAVLSSGADSFDLAQEGTAGGYLGAVITSGLGMALGVGGAAIALLAWLVIALGLSFDITIVEMARRLIPLLGRFQDWLIDTSEDWRTRRVRQTSQNAGAMSPSAERTALGGTPAAQSDPAAPMNVPYAPPIIYTQPGTLQAWVLPPIEKVLDQGGDVSYDDEFDRSRANLIEETLGSFGAPARVVEINRGPTITQFGVEPDFIESRGGRMRVRVGKITALADDLALALSARTIRIQAPVPGKGFVGIEVPNEEISLVALRDLIESEAFKRLKSPLRFALGLNVSGHAMAADLAAMPHLLIAGATGSGKSVCVNALICCLILNNTPDDLRLIMIDPKRVELTGYNGIPHLLAPVVVELEKVVSVLQWVMREMDMRYRKLAEAGCRNVQDYNARQAAQGQKLLPHLVVIVDELADLMMLSPEETERAITRLAQLARATGIHLVIATQRPSVDVVTGLIKANFPARIAFAVASGVDSRVILDQPGAERLLGRGDMLFQAPDSPAPVRLQGVFVSDSEIQRLVIYWQRFSGLVQPAPTAVGGIVDALPSGVPLKQMPLWEEMEEEPADVLYNEAVDISRRQGRASISMLQRRLRIGYTRAARLIDILEEKGIVGPPDPMTGTREILDYGQAAPPVDEQ